MVESVYGRMCEISQRPLERGTKEDRRGEREGRERGERGERGEVLEF